MFEMEMVFVSTVVVRPQYGAKPFAGAAMHRSQKLLLAVPWHHNNYRLHVFPRSEVIGRYALGSQNLTE